MKPRRFENDVSEATPVVWAVDGDPAVRGELESLIRGEGWQARMFASSRELTACRRELIPGCMILDVKNSNLNDLELRKLIAQRPEMPLICIAAEGDVPMTVKAMKAGALEFIAKPFRHDHMLAAIRSAIEHSMVAVSCEDGLRQLRARYASLTFRERQVLELVVGGKLNKLIALSLGISLITVKAHRGRVMRKMRAQSLADLINMAAILAVSHEPIDDIRIERSPITQASATATFTRTMLMRFGLLRGPGFRLVTERVNQAAW